MKILKRDNFIPSIRKIKLCQDQSNFNHGDQTKSVKSEEKELQRLHMFSNKRNLQIITKNDPTEDQESKSHSPEPEVEDKEEKQSLNNSPRIFQLLDSVNSEEDDHNLSHSICAVSEEEKSEKEAKQEENRLKIPEVKGRKQVSDYSLNSDLGNIGVPKKNGSDIEENFFQSESMDDSIQNFQSRNPDQKRKSMIGLRSFQDLPEELRQPLSMINKLNEAMNIQDIKNQSTQQDKPVYVNKEVKNLEKSCKDLERFRIHMCINSIYENVNLQLDYFKNSYQKHYKHDNQESQQNKDMQYVSGVSHNGTSGGNRNVGGPGLSRMYINSGSKSRGYFDRSPDKISRYNVSRDRSEHHIRKSRKDTLSPTKRNKSHNLIHTSQVSHKVSSIKEKLQENANANLDQDGKNSVIEGQQAVAPSSDAITGEDQSSSIPVPPQVQKKPKLKMIKMRQKRITLNVNQSKYPIIRKIAKYEFNIFNSIRDMFAPVNGQIVYDSVTGNTNGYVTNGLQRDPDDDYFDIYWMDVATGTKYIDRFTQLKLHQRINHFPGMQQLCRKNELGKLLNSLQDQYPQDFQFYPRTWLFPRDQRQLENHIKDRRAENLINKLKEGNETDDDPIFIVKPEAACQGKGIYLIRDIKDMESININSGNTQNTSTGYFSSSYESFHCVVQEYIQRPLIIDQMKFDLRLYVLLLGIDPLRIFLFKDGLARLATNPYSKPNSCNMQDMCMHLTNYAINKNSSHFMKNQSATADFVGSKRSLKFVLRYLKQKLKADTGKLMQQIKDMIIKTIIGAQPNMSHMYKNYHNDDYENSLCFEILGFDIMIDENIKPYLLEVNHAPSFATDSPLDEKIKGQVIYDTFNLLGLSNKRKKNYKQIYKMKIDLRRFQSKKVNMPIHLKEQFRKDFDDLRNQYESRNKGMYEMIYPILDEITLDPMEEKMKPYQQLLESCQISYCKKNNLKMPVPLEKLKQQALAIEQQKQRGQKATSLNSPSKIKYKNVKSKVFDYQQKTNQQKEATNNVTNNEQQENIQNYGYNESQVHSERDEGGSILLNNDHIERYQSVFKTQQMSFQSLNIVEGISPTIKQRKLRQYQRQSELNDYERSMSCNRRIESQTSSIQVDNKDKEFKKLVLDLIQTQLELNEAQKNVRPKVIKPLLKRVSAQNQDLINKIYQENQCDQQMKILGHASTEELGKYLCKMLLQSNQKRSYFDYKETQEITNFVRQQRKITQMSQILCILKKNLYDLSKKTDFLGQGQQIEVYNRDVNISEYVLDNIKQIYFNQHNLYQIKNSTIQYHQLGLTNTRTKSTNPTAQAPTSRVDIPRRNSSLSNYNNLNAKNHRNQVGQQNNNDNLLRIQSFSMNQQQQQSNQFNSQASKQRRNTQFTQPQSQLHQPNTMSAVTTNQTIKPTFMMSTSSNLQVIQPPVGIVLQKSGGNQDQGHQNNTMNKINLINSQNIQHPHENNMRINSPAQNVRDRHFNKKTIITLSNPSAQTINQNTNGNIINNSILKPTIQQINLKQLPPRRSQKVSGSATYNQSQTPTIILDNSQALSAQSSCNGFR